MFLILQIKSTSDKAGSLSSNDIWGFSSEEDKAVAEVLSQFNSYNSVISVS